MSQSMCRLCGTVNYVAVQEAASTGAASCMVCQTCGVLYVEPVTYTVPVAGHSPMAGLPSSPTRAQISGFEVRALERFRTLYSLSENADLIEGKLLEVECGIGSFLRLMQGAGWQIQGTSADASLAQVGRDQYNVPVSPAGEPEPTTRTIVPPYDMAASFGWLGTAAEGPRAAVRALARQLRPDGLLYLESLDFDQMTPHDWKHLEQTSVPTWVLPKATLVSLLAREGFTGVASGHHGSALWVLTRKSTDQSPPVTTLQQWGDTAQVLRKAQLLSQEAKQNSSGQRLWARTAAVPRRILAKRTSDTNDFGPWLKHRAILQHSKVLRRGGLPARLTSRGKYLTHFGWHDPENAGDAMLYVAVRRLMDQSSGPYTWQLEPITREVTDATIARCNRSARGIVIGGGGLLLPDTNANPNSGWQWNTRVEQVKQIQVPLVIFAIGYNLFRGQNGFDPLFVSHLNEVVRRSAFFGLREKGNLPEVAQYLEPDLKDKLSFQPCATTVLRHLYPQFSGATIDGIVDNKNVRCLAVNAAFDRHRLRFGDREHEILGAVARAVKQAEQDGWKIHVVNHLNVDANVIPWLVREGIKFEEVELSGKNAVTVMRFYQKMGLTIGMRGHAQMIPFGLGNAIISLVSHDKLGRFLQDIEHPEWGVDVHDLDLEARLTAKIQAVGNEWDTQQTQLVAAQDELWRICLENQKIIQPVLSS